MRKRERMIAHATGAALRSAMNMCHGAIVDGGVPACNRFSGRKGHYELSLHAEAAALRRAPCAKGATLYVVRLGSEGEYRESMPCDRCQSLMRRLGVRKCVFSTETGDIRTLML
jgi:deoxycytidylate deaminase